MDDAVDSGLERRLLTVTIVAGALAFAIAFWPIAAGRVFLYADLGNFHLPLRMFFADSLANGTSALWLPNLFCGLYLHGEGQVGMYHPLHWVLYRLLPLQPAFALEGMLTFPAAAIGMAVFLRRLSLPRAAAAFGGLVFGSSSYLTLRLTHMNVIAVIAHLPWLLALFDIAVRSARPHVRTASWLGIALLVASQVLLGYPGAIVPVTAYVGLYALYLCSREKRVGPIPWLAAAVALGILLGAVQLLPTFEQFAASVRDDTSLDYRTKGSLHPANLALLLVPYVFEHRVFDPKLPNPVELSFYFGSLLPIASVWVFVRRQKLGRLRGLVNAGAVACAVSLLLALGKYGGLYALLSELPLIGQLRVPARHTLLLHVVGALIAALAFADLARAPEASERRERSRQADGSSSSPCLSVLVAAAATLVGVVGSERVARHIAEPLEVWLGPILSIVCAALFYGAARGRRVALVGLALFVAADQTAYGASQWWSVPPKTIPAYVEETPALPSPPTLRAAMNTATTRSPILPATCCSTRRPRSSCTTSGCCAGTRA